MKKRILQTILFCFSFSILSSGQALNFDGTDDFVQTTYGGIAGTADRTIEAWIRTTENFLPTTGNGQGVIVDYGTFVTGQRFTFNVLWGNAIRLEVGGNGVNGSIPVNDGNWHHVAVVFTNPGNVVTLYVDGVLDTQGSLTVTANTGTLYDVMIGKRIDGVNHFTGDIDEVRIWNYALSQAELQSSMNAELCSNNLNGLMAYYQLNDGIPNANNTVNTTTDNSGNGNNGTLNNFALSGTSSNWITGAGLAVFTGGTDTYASFSASSCLAYTLPSGTTVTSSGTYSDTIPNTQCGDSILTVNVTINNNTSSNPSLTVCGSYVSPTGDTYYSSQIITYTLPSAAGCDSTVSLNLTVLNPTSSITETSCGAYTTPSGNVLTSSQIYTDTIPSAAGCDSIITIDLTVIDIDVSVTSDTTLEANETDATATFQWFECVNGGLTLVQGATNQNYTPNFNGFYAVEIAIGNCTDTSACTEFISINTEGQLLTSTVSVFPNPTDGVFTIDLGTIFQEVRVEIFDMNGRLVFTKIVHNQQQVNARLHDNAGLYQIKLTTENGTINRLILKN